MWRAILEDSADKTRSYYANTESSQNVSVNLFYIINFILKFEEYNM